MLCGEREALDVTTFQKLVFAFVAAVPHRPDGVDDEFGRQIVAFGDLGLAGFTALEHHALGQKLGPGRAVNGPVHAAPAQQCCVRGIDDGINVKRGNITLENFKRRHVKTLPLEAELVNLFLRFLGLAHRVAGGFILRLQLVTLKPQQSHKIRDRRNVDDDGHQALEVR